MAASRWRDASSLLAQDRGASGHMEAPTLEPVTQFMSVSLAPQANASAERLGAELVMAPTSGEPRGAGKGNKQRRTQTHGDLVDGSSVRKRDDGDRQPGTDSDAPQQHV